MLFSIVLSLKIGHSANALPPAGGNVKKFNFKRAPSSSSQCNDTSAQSGFNYKCAKNEGGKEGVCQHAITFCPPAPVSITATSPVTDFFLCTLYGPDASMSKSRPAGHTPKRGMWPVGPDFDMLRPESLISCANRLF